MSARWAIYIDIEGFRALYDRELTVLESLGDLMEGIYNIGTMAYPQSPNRLFAHQTGDGFVVVSEFGSQSLEVPTAIAIALLRHVAARGRFAKASVGEGEFADIWSCYPRRIRDARMSSNSVRLGGGLMTIFPVMGTALIDAVAISQQSLSGSLLTVRIVNRDRLPKGCVVRKVDGAELVAVDWVHSSVSLVDDLQQRARLQRPTADQIVSAFERYRDHQQPPAQWVAYTRAFLDIPDQRS